MSKATSKKPDEPISPRDGRAGARWLAWSHDGARIVADGPSFHEAREAARARGEADPIVEPDPIKARRV